MEIIKVQSKKTYTKEGKEYHYYNYYLKLDNGLGVSIKPSFAKDYRVLHVVAKLVK